MPPFRPAARRRAPARPATLATAFAAALAAACVVLVAPAGAQAPAALAPAATSYTVGDPLVSRPGLEGTQGRVTILPFAFDAAAVGGRVQSFSFVSNSSARGEGGPDPIQITPLVLALTGASSYTVVGRGATRVLTYDDTDFDGNQTFTFDLGLLGGSDLVTADTRVGFAVPYFQRGVVVYCDDGVDVACDDPGAVSPFALSAAYGSAGYPTPWITRYRGSDLNAGGPQVGDAVAVAEAVQRAYSIQFTAENAAVTVAAVPEPATVALCGAGLAGLAVVSRRRRRGAR